MEDKGSPPPLSKSEILVKDLIDKEMNYLKCLQAIKYVILQPLKDAILLEDPILSQPEMDKLFSLDLENFLSLSQILFYEFLQCQESGQAESVAKVFIKHGDWLKCYKDYITEAASRLDFLAKLLRTNAKFTAFLEAVYVPLHKANIWDDLTSLLCRPSRQVPIYLQTVEMLLKEYPDSKLFKDSLTKIKDVLRIIGQTDTTKLVDFNRMQALQGRLEGRVNILEPHRFVVHEETLVVVDDDDDGMQDSVSGLKTLLVGGSSSSKVHVVLFNDALLTAAATSLRSDSPLIFERFIPLDAIKLGLESVTSGTASRPSSTSAVAAMEASTPEKEAASKILKIETFGYTYLFRCGSVDSKERWIELISQHQLPILQEVAKRQQLIARSPSQPLSTPTSPRSSDAPKVGLTASLSSAQTSALNTAARLSRRIEPASVREMFAGTMTWGKKNHLVLEVMGKMQSEKLTEIPSEKRVPFFVGANGATLGREVTNSSSKPREGLLYIPNDESISRNHCAITFDVVNQVFVIRDLGSSNNTYVIRAPGSNLIKIAETTGQPTKGPGYQLKQHDIIQIGSTRLQVTHVNIRAAGNGPNSPKLSRPSAASVFDSPPPATASAASTKDAAGSSASAAEAPEVSPRRHHPKKRDKKKGGKDRQQEKEKEKEKAVVAAEVSDVDINLSYKEDNNILWKLDLLDDADEEERESFRLSESQGKRVEVVIDGDVRGMLVIYPKKTFLNVRNQIYRMLLTESERDRVGTNWRVLRMKLNNKLPVHSSQNKLVAFDAVERGDTIHVNIPSGK